MYVCWYFIVLCVVYSISSCHSTFEMLTTHAKFRLARSFECVTVLHCVEVLFVSLFIMLVHIMLVV